MGNLVAIVGRPNVGKSTLFNRLTKSRQAIVSDEAGTTRDRQYGKCEWNGREFSVVDTGGWVVNSDDVFEEEIRKQVIIATEEADLVLFLCDINNGVTGWDMDVAQILRRAKLPVILVANKADDGCLRRRRMNSRMVFPVLLLWGVPMLANRASSMPLSVRTATS